MKNDFEIIWSRIKAETGLKSLSELAEIIGRTQPTVSASKAKGEFPEGWAYRVANHFGLLTEWIVSGKGPKSLKDVRNSNRKFDILDEVESWLSEITAIEPNRKEWFELQFQDAFPTFKQWKLGKEETEAEVGGPPASKIA